MFYEIVLAIFNLQLVKLLLVFVGSLFNDVE
jgi:hypothetical protein